MSPSPLTVRSALAAALLGVFCLVPWPALAGEDARAYRLAVAAQRFHELYCSDASTAARVDASKALKAAGKISESMLVLTKRIDESGNTFLRYWRAVLGRCINQTALERADLMAFMGEHALDPRMIPLVRDAERRLGLRPGATPFVLPTMGRPNLIVGLGAAAIYLRETSRGIATGGYGYGGLSLDISGRLLGPLFLSGHVRLARGGARKGPDGVGTWTAADGSTEASVLIPFGIGIGLNFDWAIRLEISGLAMFAPNPASVVEEVPALGGPLLAGPALRLSATVPFGRAPVGVRVFGDFGAIVPFPFTVVGAQLVFLR